MTPDTLEVMARIAGGLCREAHIARVEPSPDGTWSWNPRTRVLRVGARALAEAGPEACAGIVAHEVGHAHISRSPGPWALQTARGWAIPEAVAAQWWNAVEDPRVEAWIARRFPGVQRWLTRASTEALRRLLAPPLLRYQQWALGTCIDDAPEGERLLAAMAPEVRSALVATRAARRAYREDFLPPTRSDHSDGSRDLRERAALRVADPRLPAGVSSQERLIHLLALQAGDHAVQRVFPAALALFDADVEELASVLHGDPTLAAHVAGRGAPFLPPDRVVGLARRGELPTAPPDDASRREAAAWLGRTDPCQLQNQIGFGAGRGHPAPLFGDDPQIRAHHAAAAVPTAAATQSLVDRLERALRASLRPERRVRHRAQVVSVGSRANLRRLMDAEARETLAGAAPLPVWERAVAVLHDAAFALLLDCSGSMRGPKIHAALQAADVFAQALDRVGAPYFVYGFQDQAFPLATGDVPLRTARQAIADASLEVLGCRPGGRNRPDSNDDGSALLATAEVLLRVPARQHVLLVLCDGLPTAGANPITGLHGAVRSVGARGVDLVGIGIGEDAERVQDFYPRHVVVPAVEAVAATLVRVLGGGRGAG